MNKIYCKDITSLIENNFPLSLQEKWDNSGWQVGDPNSICSGVLVAVETTIPVLKEALEKGVNLIITHHPILFHPLKRIINSNYVEECISFALKYDLNIYAAHTNLDNSSQGINHYLAQRLALQKTSPLIPIHQSLFKLNIMLPEEALPNFEKNIFSEGAGTIGENYEQCSFHSTGIGAFRPIKNAKPTIGNIGKREYVKEVALQIIVSQKNLSKTIDLIYQNHPYEEPAFDIIPLENKISTEGTGIIGEIEAINTKTLIEKIQKWTGVVSLSHSTPPSSLISKIAICGGSGGSFLQEAIQKGADVYITGEAKYNDFLDAQGKILLISIGHFESELIARTIFKDVISVNFPNFVTLESNNDINPVTYQYGKETI